MSSFDTLEVLISGRVQGVGMRPWLARLAADLKLNGQVRNTRQGVQVIVQGEPGLVAEFLARLADSAPPLAKIDRLQSRHITFPALQGFSIIHSDHAPFALQGLQIPTDVGICQACRAEFYDSTSRHYHDPFVNCCDCGPRYSIIRALPYDREQTTMAAFKLCAACEQEYTDPTSRRYHAQGICCPNCGPQLRLFDAHQQLMAQGEQAVKDLAVLIQQGGLVAVKGLGGFHLVCSATQKPAIQRLRQLKQRALKPFALLVKDLAMAESVADISPLEVRLMASAEKPIVLVKKKLHSCLAEDVAPGIDRLGVMLAYTPLQLLLFEYFDQPLIATSANLAGEPILYQLDQVQHKLAHGLDAVLDYNRDIVYPCDDSIMQVVGVKPQVLRLARGLAPLYIDLPTHLNQGGRSGCIGVGAQQKVSAAISLNHAIVLTPYIGDLADLSALDRYALHLQHLITTYSIKPSQLVTDKHPQYATTKWANDWRKQVDQPVGMRQLQHHYAHVLACMAEHQLNQTLIALSWDGTGLGDDLTLWGGEVLLADRHQYQRVKQLQPFRLLGGEQAVREPRRVALAWLFDCFELEQLLELRLSAFACPTLQAFNETDICALYQVYQRQLNAPLTSSMGRVFDGVASLLGLVQKLDYEGQAGLMLEACYSPDIHEAYHWVIENNQLCWPSVIKSMLEDQCQGLDTRVMVSRFFNGLVDLVAQIAAQYQDYPLVLTGGVFQNQTLMNLILHRLAERTVYFQQRTPINDGGIALGQVYWALGHESVTE